MKIFTNENYYEDDEFMSVSAYKKLLKCELGSREVYTPPTSTALLIGQFVDSYIEGTLDVFKASHPEIYVTRGTNKGELKSEYKQAEDICEFIKNDSKLSQYLSGEKQSIMTGKINNVPFKIKMDSYIPNVCIVDLKCMRTITDNKGNLIDFIGTWGYDVQLACYQEIVRQNTGLILPCYIAVVTKEYPIDSAIIYVPDNVLQAKLNEVKYYIGHLYDVKMKRVSPVGCGHCLTCRALRKETPIVNYVDIIGGDSIES